MSGVASASLKSGFEARARLHPDSPAAWCGGQRLTFGELNARANRVARRLRASGVRRDVAVGICAPRSLDLLVGVLGTIKAGGAYLPLDPGYPRERLDYMLADSGVTRVLVGAGALASNVLPRRAALEVFELSAPELATESAADLDDMSGERLAYVIYTSGSTGRPKGVLGTESGMLNRLAWMWRRFPFGEGEVGCVKTSLNFLDSFWEIFGPLLQGVPVLVVPDEQVKDASALVGALERGRVTRLVLVPSLLRALLSGVPALGERLRRVALWVSSGEALLPELVRAFHQALPEARLLNLYGSSEVSADCTWYDTREGAPEQVAIGRPIDNNAVRLLDERFEPLPDAATGHLYVAGVGLARGYLGRPDLTAERFLPDPEGPPGSRMYRSGDLARRRLDGVFEFVGRSDQQVKIRGFRVELGEIEAALRAEAEVAQAIVELREDRPGSRQLVAYLVTAPDAPIDTAALRARLGARLPDYMLPAAVVALPAWPLTPSGKIDRNRLPAPRFASGPRAPSSASEHTLARLFAEVLELEQVGVDDKFFDLGGDSLSSMELVSRARAAGLEFTTGDVFRHQSVAALAAAAALRPAQPQR